MKSSWKQRLRFATLTGVAVAAGGFALSGPASAVSERGLVADATIKAKFTNGKIKFAGPKSIERFDNLGVLNDTDPNQIGPHTFSLIKPNKLPQTRKQYRKCGRIQLPVCRRIFKTHDVDPETFAVGKPNVDLGREGWDKMFGKKRGDTWYTETEGEDTVREVTAPVGKTLTYFCLVHPEMRGKLKVTAPQPE